MSKRKPDQTITHRIELQTKERELIQDYMMFEQANKLIRSLASMDIKTMYAWLNVAEALGILNTVIPTVADADSIAGSIGSWADATLADAQGRASDEKGPAGGGGFSLQDDLNYMIFRFLGGTREEWEQHTTGDPLWTVF
tara:strand:- start:1564 stop:1983 length:420 start_codon:yes stop_codon:yes gene_type:complete